MAHFVVFFELLNPESCHSGAIFLKETSYKEREIKKTLPLKKKKGFQWRTEKA